VRELFSKTFRYIWTKERVYCRVLLFGTCVYVCVYFFSYCIIVTWWGGPGGIEA